VTSPNDPGAPKKGDGPNGDVPAERGAHAAPPAQAGRGQDADSPPWQRGGGRPAQPANRQADAQTAGLDARLNRFISGTATPGSGAAAPRSDSQPVDAYASELPDLSGPLPRGQQRKATPERTSDTSSAGRSTSTETREDNRPQVSRRQRGPVRASMQIRRIDPWSTLKVSLMLSVALFFVWMIAVAFLYLVLGGMGVWAKLNSNVGDLLNNTSGSSGELVSSGTIFGGAVLIGLVNIVLLTAMATIGAFIYNLATDLIGGIEVTLADRD
jgi:hypothetical protein